MKTQIWGHRGASAYAPENTLESYELAIDMKADGIELDVYITADGELAIIHDSSINRTSNGEGKVSEMTLPELRKYSFSASFADKYPNVKIPTLAEVYDLVYKSGITVNVELKASGKAFLSKVLECEKAMKMQERIIYSSFDHNNLADILEFEPSAFIAPLYGSELVTPWLYANSFGAKALHPYFSHLYTVEDYVKKSHELGICVHPWTVDNESDIRRLIDMGVDAIITNKPDVARAVLNA